MNYFLRQQTLELAYSKTNRATMLENHKASLLEPCLQYVSNWLETVEILQDGKIRQDLVEIVPAVAEMDAEQVCWDILTTVLFDRQITLQQVMGMYFESIKVDMPYRKGRVLEVFIEAVMQSPHIELKQIGKYLHLSATKQLKLDTSNYSYVIPSIIPIAVDTNTRGGYITQQFHVITGGKLKQHDGELCLDHINRLNHVTYTYDNRMGVLVQPTFDAEPKFRVSKGRYETEVEVSDRRKQFDKLFDELPSRVSALAEQGNKFYFSHRYDVRGRTYAKAWHFDYIGNKYLRAAINPCTEEKVLGANKYF